MATAELSRRVEPVVAYSRSPTASRASAWWGCNTARLVVSMGTFRAATAITEPVGPSSPTTDDDTRLLEVDNNRHAGGQDHAPEQWFVR
jgi:hypothetical protein